MAAIFCPFFLIVKMIIFSTELYFTGKFALKTHVIQNAYATVMCLNHMEKTKWIERNSVR